jgi:5'(3')-deoxyribonucleotidase
MGILSHHSHIAVDIDETLASTFALALDYYHSQWAMLWVPDFEHITEHIFSDIPEAQISLEENNRTWAEYEEWSIPRMALPLPWAQEGMAFLSSSREISIITARVDTPRRRENTEYWLIKNFPDFPLSRLFFTSAESDHSRTKSSLCLELGVTCLIDDDIQNAIDVTTHGIVCILPEKPWNREKSYSHELLFRVKHWDEIQKLFTS